MIIGLTANELVLDVRAREWCGLPYHNHPKGCPNFGKRSICPPQAPLFQDFINISRPMLLVVIGFKLRDHIETMKHKHPNWTEYQLRCVLYWQGGVKAMLRREVKRVVQVYPHMVSTDCPEAMGVHVIDTAKHWYDNIKWIPEDVAYKIAICGSPAEEVEHEIQ